jgi:hypothetical protein
MLSLRKTLGLGLALMLLPASAQAAAPDKLLPGDAEFVVHLNIRQMLDSPLYKKYGLEHANTALSQPEIKKLIEATGLDPLKDIDSLWVAGKMELDPIAAAAAAKKAVIIVRGKFDADKIEAAAKAHGVPFTSSKEGALKVYEATPPGQDPLSLAFVDKTALVMSPSKDTVLKAAKGEKLNADIAKALNGYTGKESLFVAGLITKDLKAQIAKQPAFENIAPKLDGVSAVVTATDGVAVNLSVHCTDSKTADALKLVAAILMPTLKKQAADNPAVPSYVKDILDDVKITSDKTAVTIGAVVSADVIDKAVKMK